MTEDLTPRPPREAAVSSARVAAIIEAAEATADHLRAETEARVRERIAEGTRAADNRVRAAEEESRDILVEARVEAARVRDEAEAEAERVRSEATSEALAIVARAQEEATRQRDEVESYAAVTREAVDAEIRELLHDAHEVAGDVRAEGTELADNLHDLGDSLRVNAERLLRDVQRAHASLSAALDQVDGGIAGSPLSPAATSDGLAPASSAAVNRPPTPVAGRDSAPPRRSPGLEPPPPDFGDVPEFIPPGR